MALLLALWIGATAFVLYQGPLADEAPVAGDPPGAVATGGVTREATPLQCQSALECRASVTRADLARVVANAFDLPITTIDHFDDDDGLLEEAHINRLAAAGGTQGCREGAYCPDRVVTRGQLAQFIANLVELPESDETPFQDVTGSDAAADAINRLSAAGIVEGCGADAYCPNRPVTRGELNTVLQRALNQAEPVA